MPRYDPSNEAHYWSLRGIPGVTLLRAHFSCHEYVLHTHDGFVIAATELGGAVITNRKDVADVGVTTLFVSNPAEPQAASMERGRAWRYRSLYVEPPATEVLIEALGLTGTPYFKHNFLRDGALVSDFLLLHRTLELTGDLLHQDQLLVRFIAKLIGCHAEAHQRCPDRPGGCASTLQTVIDLMRARYHEPLRLADLSAATGLSANQVIGLLKRSTGLTPHAYLTQIRLDAARRLLRQGRRIPEAALAAGFYDQSALTRHFKRSYGITPLQFVRAVAS